EDKDENEVKGTVANRSGNCPTIGFLVQGTTVMTNGNTKFEDGSSAQAVNGARVGSRAPGSRTTRFWPRKSRSTEHLVHPEHLEHPANLGADRPITICDRAGVHRCSHSHALPVLPLPPLPFSPPSPDPSGRRTRMR